jgi:hypothetical protein
MRWNVTARAMRTVKKYGSLDKYVLGVRNKWLGERAMWLRVRLQDEIRKRELADQASSGESSNPVHAVRLKTELERRSDRLVLTMPVRFLTSALKRYSNIFLRKTQGAMSMSLVGIFHSMNLSTSTIWNHTYYLLWLCYASPRHLTTRAVASRIRALSVINVLNLTVK